jgi:hypothetical protein
MELQDRVATPFDRRAHNRAIARLGGLSRSAQYDGVEMTAKARSTFRSSFETLADPDGVLPEPERLRRAAALRRLHYVRMAYESAKVRRARKLRAPDSQSATAEVPEHNESTLDAVPGPLPFHPRSEGLTPAKS